MDISLEEVRKIALLSRLELSDAEAETYRGQLRAILDSMDEIREVAADEVEPTANVLGLVNVMREDVPAASPHRDAILKAAPAREHTLFKVKKVLE